MTENTNNNKIKDLVFSEKSKSTTNHDSLTSNQMHGIASLTDEERSEIVINIIEAIVNQTDIDLSREVVDGGVDKIILNLMKNEKLSKYPTYIVHHVLMTDIKNSGILYSVSQRPVLISNKEDATVIL